MHALGLLHRDIKPATILFDQDKNLYLTDFGIGTWLGEKPGYDGHMMGTPHYIAPEILEGNVDERSEVYSVGILLYEMLTGSVPFDGASDIRSALDHWKTQPLAPLLNLSLPRSVERVILGALEKDPAVVIRPSKICCAFEGTRRSPFFNTSHRDGRQHARSCAIASLLKHQTGSQSMLGTPTRMRGPP
jgi:serine/threonine protein kinase